MGARRSVFCGICLTKNSLRGVKLSCLMNLRSHRFIGLTRNVVTCSGVLVCCVCLLFVASMVATANVMWIVTFEKVQQLE